MKELLAKGYAGSFRMIYIDPPFFTRSSFNASLSVKDSAGLSHKVHHLAYDDKFDRDLAYYIENMTVRLLLMRDLLADDGVLLIAIYPGHEEGALEGQTLREYLSTLSRFVLCVSEFRIINSPTSPYFFLVEKK